MTGVLANHKRIVIKLGSALLVEPGKGLRQTWLESLLSDMAALVKDGKELLVVSSGAIALGRTVLKLPERVLRLEESQAAASAGQIELASIFSSALAAHEIPTGQILLTLGDTEERRRYLNARATIETLLDFGAIPIINENDTVATSEIRYGDNDRLAARVATMMGADLLVLLSDVDGLYTAPPASDPNAQLIERVEAITPEIEAMAGTAGSSISSGGMQTKIKAAKIAMQGGTSMIITSGTGENPLSRLDTGATHTYFQRQDTPTNARKKWIAGQLQSSGKLIVDEGAANALADGKSLLPAGVKAIDGAFQRGDIVEIVTQQNQVLGQGLVAFDCIDAAKIIGKRSTDIEAALGYAGRAEIIHRDDMILNAQTLKTA